MKSIKLTNSERWTKLVEEKAAEAATEDCKHYEVKLPPIKQTLFDQLLKFDQAIEWFI